MSEIEKVSPSTARPTAARKSRAKAPAAGSAIPAGARKPADHAPAKQDVQPSVQRIEWREDPKTKEPYVYEIDAEDFDDLDYVDALISMETSKSDSEATAYAYIALKTLLGEDRLELWKQRERLTQGKAKFSQATAFFNSMMEQLKKGN